MKVNQIKAGAILSYAIIAVNSIVGLVYTPFMLRMLGQNEFGLYSLVSSVVAYLTVLDLGFHNAIIRYTAKYRAEGKIDEQASLFGMFLILYIAIGFLVLIIGGVLLLNVESIFNRTMTPEDLHKIKIMMALLVGNIAFTFPMSIWGGIITAYEDFIFQKTINLLRVILNPIVMTILLIQGYKAIGMVVVTTAFNIVTLVINAIYCIGKLHIKIRFERVSIPFVKEVAFYSFWIFLGVIVDRLYWSSGQFVLGIFRSASEIAVFAVAIQIQSFFTGFSYAISNVVLPRVVKLATIASREVVSDFFIKVSRIQFYPISLILFGFIVFGRQFIAYWAGPDYDAAYSMALFFMVPQLFTTMQQTGFSVLQALNKVKTRSLIILFSSVLAVVVSFPMAKSFGGIGTAICISSGLVLGNIIILNYYYDKEIGLDMKRFWTETLRLSIWPVVFTTVFYFLWKFLSYSSLYAFLLGVVFFSITYSFGCYFLSFNKDEKNLFIKPIKRFFHVRINE